MSWSTQQEKYIGPPWQIYAALWFSLVEEKMEDGDRAGYDVTARILATNLADAFRPAGVPR